MDVKEDGPERLFEPFSLREVSPLWLLISINDHGESLQTDSKKIDSDTMLRRINGILKISCSRIGSFAPLSKIHEQNRA